MLIDTTTPAPRDIPLEIDAQVARGHYSNASIVSASALELVIDFAFVGPNQPRGLVVSRVVMHPEQARQLHRALGDELRRLDAGAERAPTGT